MGGIYTQAKAIFVFFFFVHDRMKIVYFMFSPFFTPPLFLLWFVYIPGFVIFWWESFFFSFGLGSACIPSFLAFFLGHFMILNYDFLFPYSLFTLQFGFLSFLRVYWLLTKCSSFLVYYYYYQAPGVTYALAWGVLYFSLC